MVILCHYWVDCVFRFVFVSIFVEGWGARRAPQPSANNTNNTNQRNKKYIKNKIWQNRIEIRIHAAKNSLAHGYSQQRRWGKNSWRFWGQGHAEECWDFQPEKCWWRRDWPAVFGLEENVWRNIDLLTDNFVCLYVSYVCFDLINMDFIAFRYDMI